jgi:DNA-binding GntR family transcriptional regulator
VSRPRLDRNAGGVSEQGYEPLSQAIARELRSAILDGTLEPGTRVRQEAVAEQFGTSRIPVREALRQLENEGLVHLVRHSGARVARLDFSEHIELYRVREVLEPLAIGESALHVTHEEVERLKAMAAALEASADDVQQYIGADREFHLATYAAAPMPRLLRLIDDLWHSTQQYRRAYVCAIDREELEMGFLEHRLIVDALARRDPMDAQQLVRSHVRRTRITLTRHPDIFFPPG